MGIVLDQDQEAKKVIQIDDINERIMMIKLDTVPVKTTVIQVYMPTSNSKDEEVITLYEIAEEILRNSGNYNIIMMGDYNAIVGGENADSYIGKYYLGKKNDRGSMLREFANNNKMVICNTVFKQPKRRIWTWQSPRSERYQLDYIMIRSRYINTVINCHSYPGADVNSDHNLVAANLKQVRYKKIKCARKRLKWNLSTLANEEIKRKYVNDVENAVKTGDDMLPNEHWNHIKNVILKSAKTNIGIEKKRPAKKPWVTEEMIKLMDERKKWKRVDTEVGKKMYRALNNRLRRSTDKAREIWYKSKCDEIDQNIKEGKSGIAYRLAKEVTGKQKGAKGTQAIMDENGLLQTDLVNILKADGNGISNSCMLLMRNQIHHH